MNIHPPKRPLWKRTPSITILCFFALLITLVFGLCELIGLRVYASVLSLTWVSGGGSHVEQGVSLMIYLLTYFAFVILVPAALIGAVLLGLWGRVRERRERKAELSEPT